MQVDSRFIIKQANREFAIKEIALLSHQTAVQKLTRSFSNIQLEHVPRVQYNHANALATSLASKVDIQDETVDVRIIKNILGATAKNMIPSDLFDERDW